MVRWAAGLTRLDRVRNKYIIGILSSDEHVIKKKTGNRSFDKFDNIFKRKES